MVPCLFFMEGEEAMKKAMMLWLFCCFPFCWIWAKAPRAQLEYAYTDDGVRLALRRYARPGFQPLLLVHGLGQNGFTFDLPYPNQSMARYFYAEGYDVWIANLRGHGRGKYRSQAPRRRWSVDDFAIYDVDALIKTIRRRTGQKPFYIGFSMGGMVAYMYLQGVYYNRRGRVVSSAQLARERNRSLKGLVVIASPPRLSWKYPASLRTVARKNYYDYNLILDGFPGRKTTMYSFHMMDKFPFYDLLRFVISNPHQRRRLVIEYLGMRFPADYAWYPPNMTPRLMEAVIRHTVDNISGKVLAQFTYWCIYRDLTEYNVLRHLKRPYNYTKNLHKITLPIYFIAGDRDKLVCDDTVYAYGYRAVSSRDKTFHSFRGFGHVDLTCGKRAYRVVYPAIVQWLAQQRELEWLDKMADLLGR
ncbi:MAG: alpha/beta fold hydrolase [Planctomycetota bacterium]|nr:MAG: alpha/beta fold hydrolase [Planctomycetota bacterium]